MSTGTTTTSNVVFQTNGNIGISSYTPIEEIARFEVSNKDGIHANLYFKSIKRKFKFLEDNSYNRRIKKIEQMFSEAVESGQEALGERLMRKIAEEYKKSILYAKGYRKFINMDDIWKNKRKIRDGHISDTAFEKYPDLLPKEVLQAKKDAEKYFDDFVILHYYNPEIEQKKEKKEKLTEEEKFAKKDPILFGKINECPQEWYFIIDWIDENPDITLDDLIDANIKLENIKKEPNIRTN